MGLILSGDLAVLQASMLDSLAFDPFALFDDGFGPAKVFPVSTCVPDLRL
jgi:hypothetical protein